MSNRAKIHLSKLESELVNNTEWILTKQAIIKKVYLMFGELLEIYKSISGKEENFISLFQEGRSGKISKGENYKGLPYVILDYPAIFNKENVFAIRTMFWWGNFFSITLHISGKQIMQKINIVDILANLCNPGFFVCVNNNEWQHSFDNSNYVALPGLDSKMLDELSNKNFFKIAKKIDLDKWNEAQYFLEKTYRELIDFIKVNFPAGEKAL